MSNKLKTSLQTGPQEEPVGMTQAKRFIRVEHDADDADVALWLADARERAQRVTGRQLVTATWQLYLDWFPWEIRVPYPPLESVTSITYVDPDGDTQTLASSVYQVDTKSEPGVITTAQGKSWPAVQTSTLNVVTVTFVAGYGTATAVPAGLRGRILNAVAHCYEFRKIGVDEEYLDRLFLSWSTGEYR